MVLKVLMYGIIFRFMVLLVGEEMQVYYILESIIICYSLYMNFEYIYIQEIFNYIKLRNY